MKEEDIKVLARALCIMSLTLIINLVFLHLVIYASPVSNIRVFDAMGHEVIFDDDLHAVNAGPVKFLFDEGDLDDGEMYLFDDGDGDLLNPVEDGEYDLFPDEGDGTVSFYKRSSDGEDAEFLGTFHISFKDGIFDVPRAEVTERDEGIILSVSPLSRSHVYCDISGYKNGEHEEITADTDFLLDTDGVYQVAVYSEDGMGHRTYADIPSEIVLDQTGPVITAGTAEITGDKLSVILSADDALSGISYVTITKGDSVLYRGTGVKEKATIDIPKLPYGISRYDITASDNAGNVSNEFFTLEKKDDKAPELKLTGASDRGVYGKPVTIEINAEDDSGKNCTVKETVSSYDLSGKQEGEDSYNKNTLKFDKSGIYIIRAEAMDETGNRSNRSLAFAIDMESPVIKGLLGLNGSSLKSFMMQSSEELAEDDSMVQVRMIMNGVDYNGEKLTKSGKYRLQVLATDEFGNKTTEEASFEISS